MIKTTGIKYQPQGIPIVTLVDSSSAYPRGYHIGNAGGLVAVEPDLIASNIKYGVRVFGILGTMVQWVYDLQIPLLRPVMPNLALNMVENHSGGSFPKSLDLTPTMPTLAVANEISSLVLHDCESDWSEYVEPNVTESLDGADYKVGTKSVKLAVAVACAVGRLATVAIASTDVSAYNYIKLWIKSSVAITSSDLKILLDDTAGCVSPVENINLGALTANTWTQVTVALANPASDTAIISLGIQMALDKGAFNLWVDQIRAVKGNS
jgi:hypothetical protein